MNEAVIPEEQERPSHYLVDSVYEVHNVQEAWGTHDDHYIAGAIEYLSRWDKKGDPEKNLIKARYLITKRLCRLVNGVDEHGVTIMEPRQ